MNITKVLGSRVLVKVIVDAVDPATESGLVIAPTSINPSYFKGEVIMMSRLQNIDTIVDLKVGSKVAFVKYGYEDMGDGQYLVEENGLLCVYE